MHQDDLFLALEQAEERIFSGYSLADFARAFVSISSKYRQGKGVFLETDLERKVYLFTRMPATYAAIVKALQELRQRSPHLHLKTLLDVGSGPGTGMWAASHVFPSLEKALLVEQDTAFMVLGKTLIPYAEHPAVLSAVWQQSDMRALPVLSRSDLVLLSYSLGEVKESSWPQILSHLWSCTEKAILIVEPGTPKGYDRILKVRDILLGLGGYLYAPCPHTHACPLGKGDWCHFSARVSRSSMHRKVKSADLGYEDEKFSYVLFGKEPCSLFQGRILRSPSLHPGHLHVTVCGKEGVSQQTFSRKNKDIYQKIKKLSWGDAID